MRVTTYAPQQHLDAELAARTREAWTQYRESLRELEGRDYEDAEKVSWARLQAALGELAGELPTP